MKLQLIDRSLSYAENRKWKTLGWISVVLTLGIVFVFTYERFFERRLFLNRRLLADYIEENGLPEPENSVLGNIIFTIDEYVITLKPDSEWYVFKKGTLNCIISAFKGDGQARKEYAYIQGKLMEKARI